MEWRVVKMGTDMLDALHAYGLGILVAHASHSPVQLEDQGIAYQLHSHTTKLDITADILAGVFKLPTLSAIQTTSQKSAKAPLAVATFDGLLAALFTTPGVRAVSVADLLGRQRFAQRPSVAQDSLRKARAAIARWTHSVQRQSCRSPGWLQGVLRDYDPAHPGIPVPAEKARNDIGILMTLDSSASYSTRRPLSDGLVTGKVSLTTNGTRHASLLALIGAAHFLRAQRVAGGRVNFYVPLATEVVLCAETALPILFPVKHASEQAAVLQWLTRFEKTQSPGMQWYGLAYQVMQTQGAQQSLSYSRGCLDNAWLATLENRAGDVVLGYWKSLLDQSREQIPLELDHLVSSLTRHRAQDWLLHLRDVAMFQHRPSHAPFRSYLLKEVKEVTQLMTASTHFPLSAVLERETGTLRFGHALRLLGYHHPAPLRDVIDALDVVQTTDQLVRILAQAAQECAVASAKSPFIIVPSDEDLKCLLDDVEVYGARTIAGLLIILPTLRYPRVPEASSEPAASEPEKGQVQHDCQQSVAHV